MIPLLSVQGVTKRYGSLDAAVFSLVVSYTPLGKRLDHLAETFSGGHEPVSQPQA